MLGELLRLRVFGLLRLCKSVPWAHGMQDMSEIKLFVYEGLTEDAAHFMSEVRGEEEKEMVLSIRSSAREYMLLSPRTDVESSRLRVCSWRN